MKISIFVTSFENLDLNQKKINKTLDFGQNLRKISILVKI